MAITKQLRSVIESLEKRIKEMEVTPTEVETRELQEKLFIREAMLKEQEQEIGRLRDEVNTHLEAIEGLMRNTDRLVQQLDDRNQKVQRLEFELGEAGLTPPVSLDGLEVESDENLTSDPTEGNTVRVPTEE